MYSLSATSTVRNCSGTFIHRKNNERRAKQASDNNIRPKLSKKRKYTRTTEVSLVCREIISRSQKYHMPAKNDGFRQTHLSHAWGVCLQIIWVLFALKNTHTPTADSRPHAERKDPCNACATMRYNRVWYGTNLACTGKTWWQNKGRDTNWQIGSVVLVRNLGSIFALDTSKHVNILKIAYDTACPT